MTKEAIKQLSYDILSLLPRGGINEIARRTGMDRNSVRMILRGVWSNESVIQAARDILEQQKTQIEKAVAEMATKE